MILDRGGRDAEAYEILESCRELAKDLGMERVSGKILDLLEEEDRSHEGIDSGVLT